MSRSNRPNRKSIRFELRPENPKEKALIDFLDAKAEQNALSVWIRDTLIAAMPSPNKQAEPTKGQIDTTPKAMSDAAQIAPSARAAGDVNVVKPSKAKTTIFGKPKLPDVPKYATKQPEED